MNRTLLVGIVILNYNDADTTISLLKNIISYKEICDIVVVDNNSTDNSYEELVEYNKINKFVLIRAKRNGGYSYGNNLGLRYLVEEKKVDIAIILNPDVLLDESAIKRVVEELEKDPHCGLVSPRMLDNNGLDTRMWLKLPNYYNSLLDCFFIGRQLNKYLRRTIIDMTQSRQKVDILPGSFLAFRGDVLKKINYLDENVFLYYEENIIGEKLKSIGLNTYLLTDCSYIHNHSVTIRKNLSILNAFKCNLRSKLYFEKEYHHIGKVQEFILKAMMKFAVLEMSAILKIRSLLKI